MRNHNASSLQHSSNLTSFGIDESWVADAIDFVYGTLDLIDAELLKRGGDRLAEILELANLSAIIGNLFRAGIVNASNGAFASNGPHKYPDLLAFNAGCSDTEIKVALEKNSPKGHLPKAGPHIIVRYVLGNADGSYVRGKEKRGNVVWIWEVRNAVRLASDESQAECWIV